MLRLFCNFWPHDLGMVYPVHLAQISQFKGFKIVLPMSEVSRGWWGGGRISPLCPSGSTTTKNNSRIKPTLLAVNQHQISKRPVRYTQPCYDATKGSYSVLYSRPTLRPPSEKTPWYTGDLHSNIWSPLNTPTPTETSDGKAKHPLRMRHSRPMMHRGSLVPNALRSDSDEWTSAMLLHAIPEYFS